ncbi:DNA helicase [Tanacetum coccineum]|uniref:ATP-dependent DNA helicase n=1 Tax=Tanacetum coccineum TaxID=301880 RepID=A0ABQ5DQ82_9ASTR
MFHLLVLLLASCSSRITGLYLDVFQKCSEFCGVKSQRECNTTFRVINRTEDAQLYLDVYRKYSRVSGKVPCVQQGMGDGLDKRKLQPSGHYDVFEAYLTLCSSGAGSRHSRSLSQITTVFNSNLVHTDSDSQNSYPVSRDGGNTQENCQLRSTIGVSNNGSSASCRGRNVHVLPCLNSSVGVRSTSRRTGRRVLTSGSTVDTTSVASAGTSYTYSDFGDCDRRCRYCGASFWYVERLKGNSHNQTPEYHLCCGGGRIQMQPPREPPEYIKSLFENKNFMENTRVYNQMFAMTSFGAKIDESINTGRGSYVFKVSGQIYHWIGSLCPPAGEPPRFLQLYIYDTDNEVQNRMHHFGGIDNSQLEPWIVEDLIHFLDAHNELVQLFRTTRDKCRELDILEFKIRLYNAEGARGYELPTSNTLGAMVFESGISDNADFDVIIQHRDGPPQRVNKLHPSYMSLQFPFLFIYGQPGYHTELTLKSANGVGRGKRVTMLAYYRYQLHFRLQQYDLLFRGGRLFQQGDQDGYEVRGRIILPMSFTGGPRYMYAHYLDALAICRKLGNPQADVVCRVFEQKIQALIAFLKEERIFGDVTGVLYTVEFQKRGLLHCHTLLWVDSASRIRIAEDVDRFISDELPDPRIDPEGYNVVSELMMHGHCGAVSLKAPCMKGDKRDTSVSATRNEFRLDNSYVVSYNRDLLLVFRAHINVEYSGWSMLIKYMFKYISKGHFICAHEAYWRILKFDIHRREPAVQILAVHLEDMERITFRDQDRLKSMIDLPGKKSTTLTEWKSWSPRKNSKSSIGRLAYVHPTLGELFFLRMLLSACQALGLLGDDNEWEIAFEETCGSATPEELRFLFSHVLLYCDVADPSRLWRKYWKEMSYDIPKKVSERVQIPDYHLNDDSLQGYTLYEIEIILSNCGKSLHAFGPPPPPQDLLAQLANRLLMDERNYNREKLAQLKDESVPLLNAEQRQIYDLIINADTNNRQELIFVYGHGGTGKTFLWKTIISSLRSEGKIVLEVASSEESLCRITKNTQLGKLLADTDLIIWDKSPMNDHRCFEALDRSLSDIIDKPSSLFGGKSVLLGVFTLKHNMRLARLDISLEERSLVNSFASWLLDIGDRKISEPADEDPKNTSWVHIPPAYCLPPDEQGLSKLIDFIYDQSTLHTPSATTLQQKAIVCPKNETANIINSKFLAMV